MKSTKKFFAILTLVMFMMTMIPMAAFGAPMALTTSFGATNVVRGAATTNMAGTLVLTSTAAGDIPDGASITITAPAGITFVNTPDVVGSGALVADVSITKTSDTVLTIATTAAGGAGDAITVGGVTALAVAASTSTTLGTVYNLQVAGAGLAAANCGAITVVADAANRYSTIVDQDKTSQTADGASLVKFTVYGYDQYNNPIAAPVITVVPSRSMTDVLGVQTGTTVTKAQAGTYGSAAFTGSSGVAKFTVTSTVVGTSDIYIGLTDTQGDAGALALYFLDPDEGKAATAKFVAKKSITWTADGIGATDGIVIGADSSPTGAPGNGLAAATAFENVAVTANGINTFELTFKVQTSNGVPIANQVVDFSVENTTVKLNKTSAATNAAGLVKVKASASKAGTYYVKATAGSVSAKQYIKFASSGVYSLNLITSNNQLVAKDTEFSFKVQLLDQGGNQINAQAAANAGAIAAAPNNVNLKTMTKPTDANLDEDITANSGTAVTATVSDEGYLNIKIASTKINKEGDYTVKAYLNNGNSVDISFNVKTQGTVTSLTVVYDATSVALDSAVGAPTVKRLDAAGYAKNVSGDPAIKFTVNDVRRLNGAINTDGSFTTTDDKNYAGELIITAIDTEKNLTATDSMTVLLQTNGFTLTAPESTEVGKDATVVMQFVDVNGVATTLADSTDVAVSFNIMSKPAGAVVTTGTATSLAPDIKKNGKSNLTINSDTAGEVQVNVIATVTGGTSSGTYAQSVVLDFGATKTVVGAKNVTMFIGATGFVQDGAAKVTDVAPFIKDSRTFVAVRPIADAFGAEIGWNEATQTVTLTRPDMTLTIVIGSNTITKVAGGVTTEVTADVPAFIVDGRTVLPFRAVGEAFGATVNYDATTQAVSFVQ